MLSVEHYIIVLEEIFTHSALSRVTTYITLNLQMYTVKSEQHFLIVYLIYEDLGIKYFR